jgi:stearoyl-CoA desaturase (delta-9 desaturase)
MAVRSPFARARAAFLLLVLHALPISAFMLGTSRVDWVFFAVVYPLYTIGMAIGLHRYFAHRSFRTSRLFQFVLALAASVGFGDAIRFAGKHRLHHRFGDTERDVHTPKRGVWSCWIACHVDCGYSDERVLAQVPDLRRYPELMWLHRYWLAPGALLMLTAYAIGGYTTICIGCLLPPLIMLHQSSAVNYFCHTHGSRRFETPDDSTNNALIALLTYGEGWHNNHHRHPALARSGIAPLEIDMLYWVIVLLGRLGLVWRVKNRPRHSCARIPRQRVNESA